MSGRFFYENLRDDIRQSVLKAVDNMKSMGARVQDKRVLDNGCAYQKAFPLEPSVPDLAALHH